MAKFSKNQKNDEFFRPIWVDFFEKQKNNPSGKFSEDYQKIFIFWIWGRLVGETTRLIIFSLAYYIMWLGWQNFRKIEKWRIFLTGFGRFFRKKQKLCTWQIFWRLLQNFSFLIWGSEVGEKTCEIIFFLAYYIMW